LRILFFGDIVGRPGRNGVASMLPVWQQEFSPDIIIANGENAAGGMGITPDIATEIFADGVDVITLGNHVWQKRDIVSMLDEDARIIRPANYPPGVPGRGWGVFKVSQEKGTHPPLAIVNLVGRVFMEDYDDPFRGIDVILDEIDTPLILVDFHAEATSEKMAFGFHVDGRVSAVIGTHTHVQTADERILAEGTAYITDVGMCGPLDSVIGMNKEIILKKFLTLMPARFEVASGDPIVSAVVIELDDRSGKAVSITRLNKRMVKSLKDY
jgi:metallophosphoesterase (TIGR00282 family)